jgi:Rad3-related DNA helicase
MNFLEKFDGTGREPREVQKVALEWLSKNWDSADAFAIQMAVGSGKSSVAKAIANATGGSIITPSNLLVKQYRDDFPKTNFLIGKSHYTCVSSGLSCEDWTSVLEQPACKDCNYVKCKKRALTGEQTFYNPLSLYYAGLSTEWRRASVLVVDEAQQLPSMISMLAGTKLRQSMYKFNDSTLNELYLVPFLADQIRNLEKLALYYDRDKKRLKEITEELERLKLVKIGVEHDASNYAIWIESGLYRGKPDRFLHIKPLRPPRRVVQSLLDGKRIVLLSGTLMPSDIEDLVGDRRVLTLDLPSPIPADRRRVYYRPSEYKMNRDTSPADIVRSVEAVIAENPNQNTIIHVSYSMSKQLRNHFNIPIIFNDQENKAKVVDQFIREGGVFLAAGCSEGLDFRGDLCRINIIPKLMYPNLGDPVVSKRKSLEDGDAWFATETLKTTIQQTGRSTRSPDDFSKTYVLDPGFARLVRKYKDKLPQSFIESISWTGK